MKCLLTLATALAVAASASFAETFPVKPIRWVVPSSAGGGNDQLARLFGARLTQSLGQQLIVDLRPGAAGIVGSEIVAKAPPDGHTLLMGAVSTHEINPRLYSKMPYDAARDFAPVILVTRVPNVLVVHPALPVKNVKELIALARARPGELTFASGSPGIAGHLAGELFKTMAGVNMVHVPYKGAAPAAIDLIGG